MLFLEASEFLSMCVLLVLCHVKPWCEYPLLHYFFQILTSVRMLWFSEFIESLKSSEWGVLHKTFYHLLAPLFLLFCSVSLQSLDSSPVPSSYPSPFAPPDGTSAPAGPTPSLRGSSPAQLLYLHSHHSEFQQANILNFLT